MVMNNSVPTSPHVSQLRAEARNLQKLASYHESQGEYGTMEDFSRSAMTISRIADEMEFSAQPACEVEMSMASVAEDRLAA
jgi:hypothetical protein